MVVVADTTPLNYLVLIEQIHFLPLLYRRVIIPPAVALELGHPRTPESVRRWIVGGAEWLQILAPRQTPNEFPAALGPGEREAISLSKEIGADALLMDEWQGRAEAERQGLRVIGTLRVLGDAAEEGLVDLPMAIARLRTTNFRASKKLFQQVLARSLKGK